VIAIVLAALAQSYTCPGRSVLSYGVQPDGRFACVTWPVEDGRDDNDVAPIAVVHRRIFCRRGSTPILELDGRTARCRRLGPSA
jgi:hypothetical protein